MGSEVEELRKEVEQLSNQVKKNSKAIVDTGSQLLRLQVDKERRSLKSLKLDSDKPSKVSNTESESDDEGGVRERERPLHLMIWLNWLQSFKVNSTYWMKDLSVERPMY